MKLNRIADVSFVRTAVIALCCLLALALSVSAFPMTVYAETDIPEADEVPVEPSPDDSGRMPADFVRVTAVPANVDIPDFYQQVVNVSGMYIFTLPDGTIYKRIYGAVNDVYGWYEPEGQDNIVYVDSQPIDTVQDAQIYYAAVSKAEMQAMERQDYPGLFPPEEGVTHVSEVNGIPVEELTFYCVAGVVGLCLIITVAALSARSSQHRSKSRY